MKSVKAEQTVLCISGRNADAKQYNALFESIPDMKELKGKYKKPEFVFDVITELNNRGFKIVKA
jgi:hypothetical protein